MYEGAVQDLIDELGRLPGVGPKSAQRIAFHLLAADPADVRRLVTALTEVTGTAGGGLVTAVVTGSGDVVSVKIDPKAVDPDDVESLEDLVVAAIRDAAKNAAELQQTTMGPLAGGLGGLGLPGM